VHEGQAWIAMELLQGESLAGRLQRGAMPLVEALDLAIEVLGVLEPVHWAGIVHRDLKPDNVFLEMRGDGRARVGGGAAARARAGAGASDRSAGGRPWSDGSTRARETP
jgi:serine/threonine protein kinase